MLKLDDVSKVFRKRGESLRALDHVSIEFDKGFHALIGPNGGGKSTLMGVATTLVTPTEGRVVYNGSVLNRRTRDKYRRTVGYVPQHISFIKSMSVMDTLVYVAWTSGISRSAARQRGRDLLVDFGLQEKENAKTGSLSGGQLRRLGLVAAMINTPSIVFLDEPTVGLDPEARVQVRQIIGQIAQDSTVIMSTHLVEDIRFLPGALHVLSSGKLAYSGTWKDLSARVPQVSEAAGSSFEMAYGEIVRGIKSPGQEGLGHGVA
ncbi:ATP-binding cassette domain-containing protein [Corynebacterium phocae]|uniref:ATP-binding cassette domain-containing protein n=1 Tax=Corynebacterium phocae TaxID=161895 RepID=UPI0009513FFA|nr:ATP-binding cassette domain-containing protein [Corynebacterium phocae]KAA8726402.1 ATP-binding cassette domain-containing protein [Corynebacterium phocae]